MKNNYYLQSMKKKTVNQIYDRMFTKRYNSTDSVFENFYSIRTNSMDKMKVKEKIAELLETLSNVKSGYTATKSKREMLNYYIFYR